MVEIEEISGSRALTVEIEALMRSVQATFEMYVKLNKKVERKSDERPGHRRLWRASPTRS